MGFGIETERRESDAQLVGHRKRPLTGAPGLHAQAFMTFRVDCATANAAVLCCALLHLRAASASSADAMRDTCLIVFATSPLRHVTRSLRRHLGGLSTRC